MTKPLELLQRHKAMYNNFIKTYEVEIAKYQTNIQELEEKIKGNLQKLQEAEGKIMEYDLSIRKLNKTESIKWEHAVNE